MANSLSLKGISCYTGPVCVEVVQPEVYHSQEEIILNIGGVKEVTNEDMFTDYLSADFK